MQHSAWSVAGARQAVMEGASGRRVGVTSNQTILVEVEPHAPSIRDAGASAGEEVNNAT